MTQRQSLCKSVCLSMALALVSWALPLPRVAGGESSETSRIKILSGSFERVWKVVNEEIQMVKGMKALRGIVERDQALPGNPIVRIDLNVDATDADVRMLTSQKQLMHLHLYRT